MFRSEWGLIVLAVITHVSFLCCLEILISYRMVCFLDSQYLITKKYPELLRGIFVGGKLIIQRLP